MRFLSHQLPVIAWSALIFTLSAIPSLSVTNNWLLQQVINSSAHFTEYFVLTILTYRAWPRIAILYPLLFAVSDEFHQFFVPGRVTDVKDLLLDFSGIFLAIFILNKLKSKKL